MTEHPEPRAIASASAREAVREAVTRMSTAALRDHARVGTVLIFGPEGYQTSGLLHEALAYLGDWQIIVGTADDKERETDWAFIEMLNQSFTRFGTRVETPAGDPRIADDTVVVGRSLVNALAAVGGPVCVVLEHTHFADRKSAEALRFAMRRHGDQRQLLVMSSESLAGELEQLMLQLAVSHPERNAVVRVPALTVVDAQRLATELTGRPLAGRIARRFVADADGNPALIGGLIHAFRDDGERSVHPAALDLERRGHVELLPRLRCAFETAPPATRVAAEIVAVLREPTPMATAKRVAAWLGLTDAFGGVDFDDAISRELACYVDGAVVPSIAPPNRVAADAITAQMPAERRREIHAAAADLLTGIAVLPHRVFAMRDDDTTLVADLMDAARGRVAAGDGESAIDLALVAVRLAAAGREYQQALLLAGTIALRLHEYPRIFHLIGDVAALPPTPLRGAILAALEVITGRREDGIARAREVVAWPGDDATTRALRIHSAVMLPLYDAVHDQHDDIAAHVAQARHLLATERVDANAVAPDLRWTVRPAAHELWLSSWELAAAARLRDPDRMADRMAHIDQLLRTAPDSGAVIDAIVLQARTLAYAGRVADARNRLRRAIRIGASFPDAWLKDIAHAMYAHLLFLTGEWERSVRSGRIALEHALDDTYRPALPVAFGVSALVHAARGEADAVARVDRMLSLMPDNARGSVPYDPDLADLMRAELGAALADPTAQLAATGAARAAARHGSVWSWLPLHVDALVRLGRGDQATAVANEALSGGTPWNRTPYSVGRLRARPALAHGEAEHAVRLYGRLIESHTAQAQPFELARDRVLFAEALRLTGDRQAAIAQLELAATVFRNLDAAPYLARTQARAAEIADEQPLRFSHATAVDPLAGLTPREREVAVAVATGMTNREVAERLYVSVTTVNFHVRNILAKLELSSRRELRTLVHEYNASVQRLGRPGAQPGPIRS